MKKIRIKIEISTDRGKVADIMLEKKGPANEIDVLASALQTIFLKSKLAVQLAEKQLKKSKR